MKKVLMCVIIVVIMFFGLSGLYAASDLSIFDEVYSDNVYKFSENPEIKLPFIRASGERIEIDKDLNKSGLSFSEKTLSVINNLKGMQILCSSDTVKITGNLEYGIIVAPSVLIEGTIDKSILIVARNITISENAVINEDIVCFASSLELLGKIEGSLLGTLEEMNISGTIKQDLRVNLSKINIDGSSNVKGNIYIKTSSEDINLKKNYPNAVIDIYKSSYGINIGSIIRNSILFALIYLLISCKTNLTRNALEKIKSNWKTTAIVGSGSILLLPVVVITTILLTGLGLGIIAAPIAIVYSSFMIIAFLLSSFVIGTLMSEHIVNKYVIHIKGCFEKLILAFSIILILNLTPNIPYIGYTLGVAMCILSAGILFTVIFKKNKN